jgi:hypothetical protein
MKLSIMYVCVVVVRCENDGAENVSVVLLFYAEIT